MPQVQQRLFRRAHLHLPQDDANQPQHLLCIHAVVKRLKHVQILALPSRRRQLVQLLVHLGNRHGTGLGAHGALGDGLEAAPRKVASEPRCRRLARQLPVQQVVAVFGVFVNLHQLDEKLSYGILLQAVDTAVAVLVGQDEAQRGIKVGTNLLAPARDEAVDDVATLLLRREMRLAVRALFAGDAAGGLPLVFIERVEEVSVKIREEKRLGEIVWSVWVSGRVVRMRR
jgi:hypothetical protein